MDVATVYEYLEWRGDLTFSSDKLNEVDASVFSMLSYINYDELSAGEDISIRDAADVYCPDGNYEGIKLGLILPSRKINKLFFLSSRTRRFGNVTVSDYVSKTSEEDNCQFAATAFHLTGKRLVIAFRGTDDSIVGWKEDCYMSFLDEIHAQRMAVEYVEMIAKKYPDERIYLTGHSKGGNLAMYSAIRASGETAARILHVYSCDGPGLSKKTIESPEFKAVKRKITALVPQSSFIGTLFDIGTDYDVVRGKVEGAFQHDSFTWDVKGNSFVHLPSLSSRGKKHGEQFKQSMGRMTAEEKKEFIDTLFSLIESTGAKTLSDFKDSGFKKLITLIKNYSGLDKQKRELMLNIALKLFDLKKEKE